MKIAILGHGIAGAAAARMLGAAGHSVTCFERRSEACTPGAGLLLQPIGLSVLEYLGLLDRANALGGRIEVLQAFAGDGRALLDLRYPHRRTGAFGLGLQRGALQQLLRAAAAPFADVHYGCAIESVDARHGYLYGVDQSRRGPFELIVAADGRHSRARNAVPGSREPLEYPWSARLCLLDDPHESFAGRLVQRYRGTQQLAVWPLGSNAVGVPARLNLSWRDDTGRVRNVASWKRQVVAMEPHLAPLLAQIQSTDQLLSVRYAHASRSCWGIDRLILVGDAAHCMSPQLGQGASLALLDALRLAQCLAAEPDVDRLRKSFIAAREPQIRHYRRLSRYVTPLYQSSHPLPRWLRERVIPPLARTQRFGSAVLRILAGEASGAKPRTTLPVLDPS